MPLTVKQVAELIKSKGIKEIGNTERSVLRYIDNGRLKATRVKSERNTDTWQVEEADFNAFIVDVKNQARRLNKPPTVEFSDNQTNGDNRTNLSQDSSSQSVDSLSFVSHLRAENRELKTENKELHQRVEKYAFEIGGHIAKLRQLGEYNEPVNDGQYNSPSVASDDRTGENDTPTDIDITTDDKNVVTGKNEAILLKEKNRQMVLTILAGSLILLAVIAWLLLRKNGVIS